MTAGMAEVIAAHAERKYGVFTEGGWWIGCTECDWRRPIGDSPIDTNTAPLHAAHVAEELGKAGYGSIPDALREAANEWIAGDWAAAFAAVEDDAIASQASANWLRQRARLLEKATFKLAALADPEGHALVKAIRARKAEA